MDDTWPEADESEEPREVSAACNENKAMSGQALDLLDPIEIG